MSLQQGKVVTLILLDRFGPVVSEVGKILFQNGPTYLKQVKSQSELSLAKVRFRKYCQSVNFTSKSLFSF